MKKIVSLLFFTTIVLLLLGCVNAHTEIENSHVFVVSGEIGNDIFAMLDLESSGSTARIFIDIKTLAFLEDVLFDFDSSVLQPLNQPNKALLIYILSKPVGTTAIEVILLNTNNDLGIEINLTGASDLDGQTLVVVMRFINIASTSDAYIYNININKNDYVSFDVRNRITYLTLSVPQIVIP